MALCVVSLYISDKRKEHTHLYFTTTKAGFCCVSFVILCPSRGFSAPAALLLPFFFLFFFYCGHLCPAECNSQPSCQKTRKAAILPAGLAWLPALSSLRPTDCGGMGQPLRANGSCPPPRAENELECCLPQTHQAAARKKDRTTHKLQPKTRGNFLPRGETCLR